MKISYNWLKEYIDINIEPSKIAEILTNTGLEVGGLEEIQSIKGGLEGLVIGEVKTCVKHPNSDHLNITTVDLGEEEPSNIVCGAPNVATGQKVVVATIGTKLYDGDKSFVIKKSKIRGEVSLGMICSAEEIGVGTDNDGIMVLPNDIKNGTLAKDYFNIENDTIIEIDLTPNRIDGASHIGVARDIVAYIKQTQDINYKKPSVDDFKIDNTNLTIPVDIENNEACLRYSSITISNVKVTPSPDWLQTKLKLIGLTPINNVVDITNFVLHETGQPLHAFDVSKIDGNRVIVKTEKSGTKFTTLDGEERSLNEKDLMICNKKEPMCIAGVFGGIDSGVTEKTTNIFIESAYFNPVYIRKTARRHGLNTDASFRFERGTDPNGTIYALKRAALLIKEIAGGEISSELSDIYTNKIEDFKVTLRFKQVNRLIGEELPKETIIKIIEGLEIKIDNKTDEYLDLSIPPYRVDVQREADVIEEILRIYGYNTVPISNYVQSTLAYAPKPDNNLLREITANYLSNVGFNEMMSNSLTKLSYYDSLETLKKENTVKIFNPLSQDLNAMRQTLLFGALEAISFNTNRQNPDLKLFEFGNCYFYENKENAENPLSKYKQQERLSIVVSGNRNTESWHTPNTPVSFYYLKSIVENLLTRLGVNIDKTKITITKDEIYSDILTYSYNNIDIANIGVVSKNIRKQFDIKQNIYSADLFWDKIVKTIRKHKIEFAELPKYPSVKRDLSLLLDQTVTFNELKEEALKTEKKLLRSVSLFDVYEGDKLDAGKKSYALSFIIRDDTKTLNDKQIDKIMKNIIRNFENKFKAIIR
jgi:phenylalanyl-tRNA synthetase beta chain